MSARLDGDVASVSSTSLAGKSSQAARHLAQKIAKECLALRARQLNRLVTRVYEEAVRPHGITAPQLNLLVGIGREGPIQASALGRLLDLEKSTLSRNLARMVDNGWVGGTRDLTLTAAGERLLLKVYASWAEAQSEVQRRLGGKAIPMFDDMARGLRNRRAADQA